MDDDRIGSPGEPMKMNRISTAVSNPLFIETEKSEVSVHGRCQGGRGMRTTPIWGKIFEIDHENLLHRKKKIFEIDRENPRFLRILPPFKILVTPLQVNSQTQSREKKKGNI
jgi:hypothetical protein